MNFKKIISIILSICCIGCILASCNKKEYSDTSTCENVSNELKREISVPAGEFSKYTEEELKFFFSSPALYNDCSVIYSKDTEDIAELGVLHAEDENAAKKLLDDVKLYIKKLQEQKLEFLSNYSPNEVEKLNSAEARRFGNYVIFTVASPNEKKCIFEKAENILKK